LEVRYFLSQLHLADDVFIISDDAWAEAKRALTDKFRSSTKLEICLNILRDFEATNPVRKYKSDLEVFIRESKLEDFFDAQGETIFVSTIHKAKGKEFVNVFLMLENFYADTDEAKRQLYVAMTRAKQTLTIHTNTTYLDNITAENFEQITDTEIYLPPDELVMVLAHKDIWLDYFADKQYLVSHLISGEALTVRNNECIDEKGRCVLKFSKQFIGQIEMMQQRSYALRRAVVGFIVYWAKEDAEQEVKIILPEVTFEKGE
jgi:ATP-dependent DNA helicase RecQ